MIYKIELKEKIDNSILENLKLENKDRQGISDLFSELIMLGRCETYNQHRARCISNILNKANVGFRFKTLISR